MWPGGRCGRGMCMDVKGSEGRARCALSCVD